MKPVLYTTFANAIEQASNWLQHRSQKVHSAYWQGSEIAAKPEMMMHEVAHLSFAMDMAGMMHTEEGKLRGTFQSVLNEDIKPNQPWCDMHFLERVGGQPLNPGVEWANWPYGKSADTFREDWGPFVTATDWAYLAALIDADGSITIRKDGKPHVVIHQVDHDYLWSVYRRFNVGQVRTQENNSELSDRPYLRWQISARDELKWLLGGVMRYLRLKRATAQQAFDNIPDFDLRKVGNKQREPTFNHNYMQRYWPKYAGMTEGGVINETTFEPDYMWPHRGIKYEYGDLFDVINLLGDDPLTRQAYLPIWFPEDTGGGAKRAPCTIGYHFMMRNNHLDVNYHIRSCDFVRHFRDDLYLTARLVEWVIERLQERDDLWLSIRPGKFYMQIGSLHCFANDFRMLYGR